MAETPKRCGLTSRHRPASC